MAEAFAALSVAANIAQFLDYTRALISGGKEVYASLNGARNEHQTLKLIIEDIKSLALEPQLADTDRVRAIADKLLAILTDLEIPRDARFRGLQTMQQTVRGAAKKKDIKDLQGQIADIDARMSLRASRLLEQKHYSSITSMITTLAEANESLRMTTTYPTLGELKSGVVTTLKWVNEAANIRLGMQHWRS
ncbi:hypothetical protein N431DRAFT_469189 [Stipitochalara longipes BDJ]|nr:hypothetical protein N431DRAFT_469189 [Stipitochalara longipes BDJ]